MFKLITAAFLLVFSNMVFPSDTRVYEETWKNISSIKIYDGIWQDITDDSNYYTIHQKDNTLVLINLSEIESNKNTLKSAYIGNVSDFILARVSPDPAEKDIYDRLKLEFQSLNEGMIYPACDTCSTVVAVKIRRIF